MKDCPKCGGEMIGVEYNYTSPNYYDGVSEWQCSICGVRYGRWTSNELKEGEEEPKYGRKISVQNN